MYRVTYTEECGWHYRDVEVVVDESELERLMEDELSSIYVSNVWIRKA